MKKAMKSGFLLLLFFIACTQLQAKSLNLLTNPGAEDGYLGWVKTNGGSGWNLYGSDVSHSGDSCWVGSYAVCSLSQKVSLTEKGYSEATLDSVKPISFGAYVASLWFAAGKVSIYLQLLDKDGNVLGTHYLCNNESIGDNAPYALKDTVLENYGTGVRAINFCMTSKDDRGWAGNYAPLLDDAFLYVSDNYLKISSNGLSVDADGVCDTLTFAGSDSVSVSRNVRWIALSTSKDSIFVNVHKNTEAIARTGYITVSSDSISKTITVSQAASEVNLLSNPGAEDSFASWTKIDGGDGWIADSTANSHSGYRYWIPSYQTCTLSQTVSLMDKGLTEAQLDLAPAISMGAFVDADYFWGGTISIYGELLDATGNILSTQFVSNNELIPGSSPWAVKDSVFENYGTGVRAIKFYLVSKGTLGWAGHYAPAFDDAFIHVSGATATGLSASKTSSIAIKMSQNQLSVDLGDLSEQEGVIYVYNLQGKQVLTAKTSGKITILDLSLGKGLYLVKVQAGNEMVSEKVVLD